MCEDFCSKSDSKHCCYTCPKHNECLLNHTLDCKSNPKTCESCTNKYDEDDEDF